MIFAIDFDGTIVTENWPDIGPLKPEAEQFIRNIRKQGHQWILLTMRQDRHLQEALDFLKEHDLSPDCVNDNHPDRIREWGNNPRKVYADIYIDDHNAGGVKWSSQR